MGMMAHYAFLDENNVVTQVIVGRNETDVVDGISDWETYYSEFCGQRCLRTSYNTFEGTHRLGGVPFRGNFAGIGFTYDEELDGFIPPKPFLSWVLNPATCSWVAPVPKPDEVSGWVWDENALEWLIID